MTWTREDFLKAQGNQDACRSPSRSILQGVRQQRHHLLARRLEDGGGAARRRPRQRHPREADEDRKAPPKPDYACEDINTAALSLQERSGPISRSFAVAAGAYE